MGDEEAGLLCVRHGDAIRADDPSQARKGGCHIALRGDAVEFRLRDLDLGFVAAEAGRLPEPAQRRGVDVPRENSTQIPELPKRDPGF